MEGFLWHFKFGLRGKKIDVWKSALDKLEAIPASQIIKKLKLGYDSLKDDHDKNLFLDMACFFTRIKIMLLQYLTNLILTQKLGFRISQIDSC